MKKFFLVLLIVLFVSGITFSQPDQFGYEKKKEKKKVQVVQKKSIIGVGIGYGIPYGVIGAGIEITPAPYVGITGGIGYAIEGVGYSFGLRLYPLGDRYWSPMLSAYYGVVGAVLDVETFNGGAFGGGVKLKRRKYSVTAELLVLVHEEKAGIEYGSPVKISGGFLWHL